MNGKGPEIGSITLARLTGRTALDFGFFAFLHKDLNIFALLKALEAIQDTSTLENLLHRFGRQSAILHPVIGAVFLHMDRCRVGTWVIETQNFQKATIARRLLIGSHNAIRGLAFKANTT